jgi:hypothetical protein
MVMYNCYETTGYGSTEEKLTKCDQSQSKLGFSPLPMARLW